MAFGLIEARILALLFSSFFLGAHLTTTTICLWALLVRNPAQGRRINWAFFTVTVTMAIIGTLGVAVDGFVNVRVWTTGDVMLYIDESSWESLFGNIMISLQLLIGDAVLIYRCWIVYEYRLLMVAPSLLLWVGNLVATVILLVRSVVAVNNSSGINSPSLVPETAAQQALTVALNTLTSSLIVYRIWTVSRLVRAYIAGRRQDRLLYAIRVIVESGGIYALTATITLITVLTRNAAVYITANSLVQITAICFNLIIIRFDRNLASKTEVETVINSKVIPLSSLAPSSTRAPTSVGQGAQHVEIAVSRNMEVDTSFSGDFKAGSLKDTEWSAA
ncbi:hypothetical protein CERSUDRAFT_116234 [Gelatoporia subvermispora B]|uniref:Uncharacterized protein n=1 Tax=Ceriporiopsis subvermispora (strain B) TaxID=914234 RepID=M2QEL3_CERS8|nr:hypothetical protein CERSUDRAFT_116234 [Gelatoporia subvermispora B]